jgi:hypothetical protein
MAFGDLTAYAALRPLLSIAPMTFFTAALQASSDAVCLNPGMAVLVVADLEGHFFPWVLRPT